MKNITVSVDDEIYRKARVAAARLDTSVSALVREYLNTLGYSRADPQDAARELFSVLDKAKAYRAGKRLSREAAHER